jgi:O-antigen ligase
MAALHRSKILFRPSLSFVVLGFLLVTLWVAGGASRDDVVGQVVVRAVAWLSLVVILLFGDYRALWRVRAPALLLLGALLLAMAQLVPLPPSLWQALPGRTIFTEAAVLSGQAQPWRPWSIVPGATANAAASLVVPLAVLLCAGGLKEAERRWVPGLVLALIAAAALVGLLQFSGVAWKNPLINDTIGQVSGTFANRNHLALFLVLGCLLAPVWAFTESDQLSWRGPVALGLVLLFTLTILAGGSRAGLGLGVVALAIGLLLIKQRLGRALSRYPSWVLPVLTLGIIGVIAAFVLISVAADRAVSIQRALAVDSGQDMRSRGLPIVLEMARTYFPLGSGLGGFDSIFRMHEPFGLLKPTYFNHAHNDFLEIVLDAGLPGLLLLLAGLSWWAWASVRAWRAGSGMGHALAKMGSAMLLLVAVASLFDYPARTPMMMAMIMVAALWLSGRSETERGAALPASDQHL